MVAKTTDIPYNLAHEMIGTLFDEMREALIKGDRIEIRNIS